MMSQLPDRFDYNIEELKQFVVLHFDFWNFPLDSESEYESEYDSDSSSNYDSNSDDSDSEFDEVVSDAESSSEYNSDDLLGRSF